MVGGHYDSINGNQRDAERDAPGANDDASGTAVVCEACRVMCATPFRATIKFVCYDGEEMGLLGCCLLLAGFLVLFWRGVRAAMRAPDRFGFYLALGVTCLLVMQALIHMGVCLGLLPTKGLPLPFISYGGSSLVATLAATGLLLNVSQHS